jgi:hypothetical protein
MPAAPILLLGSPRSGTTWLGKILDSHPDVFYLHEPDTVQRSADLPYLLEAEDIEPHRAAAADYLASLGRVRQPKAAASLPVFPKRYRGPFQERLRHLWVYAA